MNKIWKFVITGGPCAGKTSGIPIIKNFFENKGYKVFTLPEAVTVVRKQIGLEFSDLSVPNFIQPVIETMISFENIFKKCALQFEKDVIILCDRGLLDPKAYVNYSDFIKILEDHNLTEVEAASRYDAVFHLITAANGAENHYIIDGNRDETLEEARKLDKKTIEAWSIHSNFHIIDNSTPDFDSKIHRLITNILEIIQ